MSRGKGLEHLMGQGAWVISRGLGTSQYKWFGAPHWTRDLRHVTGQGPGAPHGTRGLDGGPHGKTGRSVVHGTIWPGPHGDKKAWRALFRLSFPAV